MNFSIQAIDEFQSLILISLPVTSLFFGWQPFIVTPINIFLLLVFPIIFHLLIKEITSGYTQFWRSEILSIMRFPICIKAAIGLFKINKAPWNSSNKNIKGKIDWFLLIPQLSILFFSASSILYGVVKLYPEFKKGPIICVMKQYFTQPQSQNMETFKNFITTRLDDGYSLDLLIMCGLWSFFSIIKIISYLRILLKKIKNSSENFRFNMNLPIFFEDSTVDTQLLTSRISEDTITVSTVKNKLKNIIINKTYKLKILLPSGESSIEIRYAGIIGNEYIFNILSKDKISSLNDTLYSVAWHRYLYFDTTPFHTISSFLKHILNIHTWCEKSRKVETVIFNEPSKKNQKRLGFVENHGKNSYLFCFFPIPKHSSITAKHSENGKIKTYKIRSNNEASKILHLTKNLDNTECYYYQISCVK